MSSVLSILLETQSIAGANDKIAFLEKHKGNQELLFAFYMAYSKSITFGIKPPPFIYDDSTVDPSYSLHIALRELLDVLGGRKLTGNNARDFALQSMHKLNCDDQEVYRRVMNSDLECGVGASSANKVWSNLIEEQHQLLSRPQTEENLANIHFPAFAQFKADGARGLFRIIPTKDGLQGFINSRNGNKYFGLEHIIDQIISVVATDKYGYRDGMFYGLEIDGELVVYDENGHIDRHDSNGILNKSVQGTISKEEALSVGFAIWEVHNAFPERKLNFCELPVGKDSYYHDRLTFANEIVDDVHAKYGESASIHKVETTIVYNLEEAQEVANRYIAEGFEGIILKNLYGKWRNGRSKDQVKFKEAFDVDLRIVGFIPHSKDEGKLGSFMLESDCGMIKTNCGSGIRDKSHKTIKGEKVEIPIIERDVLDASRLWAEQDKLIGKIVEIQCNGFTMKNKKGETKSLLHPVIKKIRYDKDTTNLYTDYYKDGE